MSNGYIFSALGEAVSRTGNAVYGVSQARYKLYENQVNEVMRLTEDNMNTQIQSYVANASEAELPDLYNNASKNVWEKYSSIDEIKRNTNNRFSDEVYEEAVKRLQSQYRPKFESKMKTYEDVSSKVGLTSQFVEGFSSVSTYGDWMNIDDPKASARNYTSAYDSYIGEFNGFEIVNDNGIFSKNGESGKEMMMQSSFTRSLDDFTKSLALKGDNKTTDEFISDYEKWWTEFSKEIGFDSSKSKTLLDTSKSDIQKKYEDYKKNLQASANQKVNQAQQIIYNDTDKTITDDEMFEIYKACGLADWETNWYSQKALAEVSSMVYDANLEYFNTEVTNYFKSFVDGKSSVYDPNVGRSIDYVEFIKNGVAHKYDGEGNEVNVNKSYFSYFDTTGMNEAETKAFNEINKNLNELFSEKKETYQYNFEALSKDMAKRLDLDEDGYAPIMFDKLLTQRFLYETGDDNGLIKKGVNDITSIINSNDYSATEKQIKLNAYYENGYLDDAQYQQLQNMISFGYKEQYNYVMKMLDMDLPDDVYKFISSNPESVKYIQDGIEGISGDITGVKGQELIAGFRAKFSAELSDNISVSSLSKAMSALTDSNYYTKGVLSQLGDYSVGSVMNKYFNGDYNYLGMNYLVEQIKPAIMTMESGKTTKGDVNNLMETIWKLSGYSGTYKESKSDYKKEICETALLIATCSLANDRNLSEFIDGALGKEVSNILYYDETTKSYSPVVMNSVGLGVMMESTGSGENMFRIIQANPSSASYIINKGVISSGSGLVNLSENSYSSESFKKSKVTNTIRYGQKEYATKTEPYYTTIRDNSEMMGYIDAYNRKVVRMNKNNYWSSQYKK